MQIRHICMREAYLTAKTNVEDYKTLLFKFKTWMITGNLTSISAESHAKYQQIQGRVSAESQQILSRVSAEANKAESFYMSIQSTYLCFTYYFVFFFWCEKFGHTTCSKFGKKVQFYSSPCLQSLSFGKVRITGMMMRPSTQVEEGRRQDTMGWNMFLNFAIW